MVETGAVASFAAPRLTPRLLGVVIARGGGDFLTRGRSLSCIGVATVAFSLLDPSTNSDMMGWNGMERSFG